MTTPDHGQSKDDLTPAKIVAAAQDQEAALIAFIAQELEHWGFAVAQDGRRIVVNADGFNFSVGAARVLRGGGLVL